METLLGALAFAAFLLAQVAAVIAVQAEGRSQAHDRLQRERDARAVWDSAT